LEDIRTTDRRTQLPVLELRTTVRQDIFGRSISNNFFFTYLSTVGRFKNVPMPQRNSRLSLVGEVIVTHEESKMVAVLHNITYLSSKNRYKARLPPLEYPMLRLVLWVHLPNDDVGIVGLFRKRLHQSRKENVLFLHHRRDLLLLRIVWEPIMNEAQNGIQPESTS